MKRKKKISIIGAGKTAEEYIKVLKNLNVSIEGIYSRTASKAEILKKKYKIRYLAKGIGDLYKKTKSEIVFIIVSVENTKSVCLKASKYNWNCFVEKPFGINLNQSKELIKKLGEKKRSFYIAFNRNYYGSVLKVNKLITKNPHDKRYIELLDQQDYRKFDKYKYNKVLLENLHFSNSIHLFCIALKFARGKVKKVENILFKVDKNEKYIKKKILFTSGDIVFLTSIWNRPAPWTVTISTKKLFFRLTPTEKLEYINNNNIKKYDKNKDDTRYKPGLKKMIKEYVSKKKYPNNINYSLELMKLINKCYNI